MSKKQYTYGGITLFVGAIHTDKNGYNFEIIWCGPQMVKYIMVEHPYDVPHYSRH